jgi:hypothetical protein
MQWVSPVPLWTPMQWAGLSDGEARQSTKWASLGLLKLVGEKKFIVSIDS